MLKKRFFVGVATAALLLSGVGVGAANASISYFNGGLARITASYVAGSSHTIRVFDAVSDGWGGYSDWGVVDQGSSGRVTNTSGVGTTAYSGYILGTGYIVYAACAKNGSVTIGCSSATSNFVN